MPASGWFQSRAGNYLRGSIIGFATLFGAMGLIVNSKISGVLFDDWMYQAPVVLMAGMNLLVCLAATALRVWEIKTGVVTHPTAAAAVTAGCARSSGSRRACTASA